MVEAILSSGETIIENLGETNILNNALVITHNELKNKEKERDVEEEEDEGDFGAHGEILVAARPVNEEPQKGGGDREGKY